MFLAVCCIPVAASSAQEAEVEQTTESPESQADALYEAARTGDVEEVRELLADGVPVDVKTPYQATALMFACSRGHEEVVAVLLEAGADPNSKDNFYSAGPMAWAAMKQQDAIALKLLEAGSKDAEMAVRLMLAKQKEDQAIEIIENYELDDAALARLKRSLPKDASDELKALFKDVAEPKTPATTKDWSPTAEALARYVADYAPLPENDEAKAAITAVEESGDFAQLDGVLSITRKESLVLLWGDEEIELKPSKKTNVFNAGEDTVSFLLRDDEVTGLEYSKAGETVAYVRLRKSKANTSSAASLAADLAISSADWPQFRGNGARGVAEGQKPPRQWDVPKGENVLWKTPVEGLAHSCPIVVGDKLFLTTAVSEGESEDSNSLRTGLYGDVDSVEDDSPHRFEVHCYHKRTGDLLWKKEACTAVPQVKRHLKGTHANPTPASNGEVVVAFFGSEGIYCYAAADGKLLWQRDLGLMDSGWFFDASYQWGFAASPIIYGNKVIVQCDIQKGSFIAALDLETGEDVWRTQREEIPSWSSPTIVETSDGPQLVTNATNYARAYNPDDGSEIWRLGKNSEIVVPTPFTAHGLIYVTSGYRPVKPVLAIRPSSRGDISLESGEDSSDEIVWSNRKSGPYMVSPVVYGDFFYTCNSAGILECLEAKTGERVYRKRIGVGAAKSFVASILAADGHIYIPSEEGVMLVVKAGREYELVSENELGESMLSTPAISDGVMYLRGAKHLIAVGNAKSSGE